MEPGIVSILERHLRAGGVSYRIALTEEDLSRVYPGMIMYTAEVSRDGKVLGRSRTNTLEYSPCTPLHARDVGLETVARWETLLGQDPGAFPTTIPPASPARRRVPASSAVIIQGSPRPGGNCAILASWAADAAREMGVKTTVFFPHDLDIHPCIGCYQCYNTGTCVFEDDMTAIIDAVAESRLVVVCSPVYTNSVPAGLKALIDRFQALHAERILGGDSFPAKGLLMAVAGRKGPENFRCVSAVARAFFSLIGMTPAPPLLVDGMDKTRDVRVVAGLGQEVRSNVKGCLVGA